MARKTKKSASTLTVRERRVEAWFELPMLIVTILLIVTLVAPLMLTLDPAFVAILAVANVFIWFAFYIELGVKLAVAQNKWQGLKRNWYLIVIVVSPLLLPFRIMRLSRLVSAVRLLGLQKYVNRLKRQVKEIIYSIEYILISISTFVVLAALMIWQIEKRFDGEITSLPDALWWAVITITTIGYGDIVPASPEGKIAGAVIGLLGTVLFMVFVARITSIFVQDKELRALKQTIRKTSDK